MTCNGERLLEQCLASLAFCDTILVIDSGSTDATEALCIRAGAQFIYNPWTGFANQFTFAMQFIETDWLFILDQDELCEQMLQKSILKAIASQEAAASDFSSYAVNRVSWYFDRFMKHSGWYPDWVPRLFKKGHVTFSQDAHIHYHSHGQTKQLPSGHIIHYPYVDFAHQWNKLGVYAQQGADHMRQKGVAPSLCKAIVHAFGKFLRIYLLKQGFRDGKAGFIAACFGAFYTFSKYVRVFDASWGAPYTHKAPSCSTKITK